MVGSSICSTVSCSMSRAMARRSSAARIGSSCVAGLVFTVGFSVCAAPTLLRRLQWFVELLSSLEFAHAGKQCAPLDSIAQIDCRRRQYKRLISLKPHRVKNLYATWRCANREPSRRPQSQAAPDGVNQQIAPAPDVALAGRHFVTHSGDRAQRELLCGVHIGPRCANKNPRQSSGHHEVKPGVAEIVRGLLWSVPVASLGRQGCEGKG